MSTDSLGSNIAMADISSGFIKGWLESIEFDQEDTYITLRRDGHCHRILCQADRSSISEVTPQSIVELTISADGDKLVANHISVIHRAEPLPIDLDAHDVLDLNFRHLTIRTRRIQAAAKFRHLVQKYAREYLDGIGCINVQTPIITEASCVCSGSVFTFPYYGKRIGTLIQSPWMYADVLTTSLERIYALNPSFRRENDATNIHLVEIWQLQVDIAWATNADILRIEEDLIRYIANNLLEHHASLYAEAGLSPKHLANLYKPFERVTYEETISMLNKKGESITYGDDYSKLQSEVLASAFDRPFFIVNYPQSLKNFWFTVYADRPDLTPSNDLFAHTGHGELIGGGTRVSDADQLRRNLEYFGHDEEEFNWFLDSRRFGCAPHSGFSMGFDRIVAFFMGVSDIREATLFPRVPFGPIKP